MPLTEFASPEITQEYLRGLDKDHLIELLQHKTAGLIVASRIQMTNSPMGKELAEEVKKIQEEIKNRMAK